MKKCRGRYSRKGGREKENKRKKERRSGSEKIGNL